MSNSLLYLEKPPELSLMWCKHKSSLYALSLIEKLSWILLKGRNPVGIKNQTMKAR